MSLLRWIRKEVAGACRSIRYDLGKRPVEPPAGGPDVTSTGMYTFGGGIFEEPVTGQDELRRPPRRAVALATLGLLTVVGAGGTYLAVVNGLAPLFRERPAAADTFPIRPASPTNADTPEATAGLGRGPAARPSKRLPATTATRPVAATLSAGPRQTPGPVRTVRPTATSCDCGHPPVPTPTAPTSSPSPTPSATTSPTPDESPEPSQSSATPDDSTGPRENAQVRHRRSHY